MLTREFLTSCSVSSQSAASSRAASSGPPCTFLLCAWLVVKCYAMALLILVDPASHESSAHQRQHCPCHSHLHLTTWYRCQTCMAFPWAQNRLVPNGSPSISRPSKRGLEAMCSKSRLPREPPAEAHQRQPCPRHSHPHILYKYYIIL